MCMIFMHYLNMYMIFCDYNTVYVSEIVDIRKYLMKKASNEIMRLNFRHQE